MFTLNPTVLLILSKNSVQSDWVEHEARTARELEKELKRDVLCPVARDAAWLLSRNRPWSKRFSSYYGWRMLNLEPFWPFTSPSLFITQRLLS